MRKCRRCKTKEAQKGSLNCESCNERNKKHTEKMILNASKQAIKSPENYGSHGGLGNEWDRGVAGHY